MKAARILKRVKSNTRNVLSSHPDKFLGKLKGVIHVGANVGQEKDLYERYNLNVIWIEPIPKVYKALRSKIKEYPKQKAYRHLITDKDASAYHFHVANNFGASSSILKLADHKQIWPEVEYEETILMESITLFTLCKTKNINISLYDGLIIDTQGSELMVLKGAIPLLPYFKFIKIEVPDFNSYKGCCKVDDISAFLTRYNFKEVSKHKFAYKKNVGSYYDIIFKQCKDR